jgi:hypothetical protein
MATKAPKFETFLTSQWQGNEQVPRLHSTLYAKDDKGVIWQHSPTEDLWHPLDGSVTSDEWRRMMSK